MDVISKIDYIPTFEDYIKIKTESHGIVENRHLIHNDWKNQNESTQYLFVTDISGAKWDRKKCIRCLSYKFDCVFYIVSLDDYCVPIFEDENKYCLKKY